MLITRHHQRRAIVVPVAYFLIGAPIALVSCGALARAGEAGQAIGGLVGVLLGGGAVLLGAFSCRSLRVRENELVVRSLRDRRALTLVCSVLGVRLLAGSRSSSYVVFVTDARVSSDVGEWASEKAARKAIARLEEALLPAPQPSRQRDRARREVDAIEAEWKGRVAKAQQAVDEYYRSPAWRWTKVLVVGGVILYLVVMSLYFELSSK